MIQISILISILSFLYNIRIKWTRLFILSWLPLGLYTHGIQRRSMPCVECQMVLCPNIVVSLIWLPWWREGYDNYLTVKTIPHSFTFLTWMEITFCIIWCNKLLTFSYLPIQRRDLQQLLQSHFEFVFGHLCWRIRPGKPTWMCTRIIMCRNITEALIDVWTQ